MVTDVPTRKNRAEFLESDRLKSLDVPQNGTLLAIAKRLDSAMKSDRIADVRSACAEFFGDGIRFLWSPDLRRPRAGGATLACPERAMGKPWHKTVYKMFGGLVL